MKKYFLAVFLLVSFLLAGSFVFAVNFPNPTGYVNDFAGVLDASQRAALEQTLRAFEQQTSNEISVAIVSSLEGLDEFTYSYELFSRWKIGKTGKNNGILFFIALSDRAAFVQVGKGLEGALPDSLTGTILRNEVFPSFKAGDYAAGISRGLTAIIQATKGEYKAEPGSSRSGSSDDGWLNILFPLGFILLQYFLSFLARSKSWWLGGVLGGAGGLIFGYFFLSVVSMFIATGIFAGSGLFLDYVLSKNFQKRLKEGKPTDFWHSGGGFWFGGGRGGGGGFGGFGGGISGGGGAGGRW
ncbi:TPM domain-containing protein [Candidatus Peregrinibacteria bacterium]|nr:TPM domain-containing protein [Candidatus Peregrinibacteria bacterium]